MTVQVRFYACEGEPLRVALTLVRKARLAGQRVGVAAASHELERLSQSLWRLDDFFAHSRPGASAAQRRRSPVVLGLPSPTDDELVCALWLNLLDDAPLPLAQAERVFELVGPDEEARQRGRLRVQRYRQAGIQPEFVSVPA